MDHPVGVHAGHEREIGPLGVERDPVDAAILIRMKRLLCIAIAFRDSFCLVYNSSTPITEENEQIRYADGAVTVQISGTVTLRRARSPIGTKNQ